MEKTAAGRPAGSPRILRGRGGGASEEKEEMAVQELEHGGGDRANAPKWALLIPNRGEGSAGGGGSSKRGVR